MLAAVEVEVVGHNWLSDLAGPALIAVAAIVAAGIAAYTASRNHRKQLEHDRSLRERDHTRDVLDAAIENVISVMESVLSFSAMVKRGEAKRADLRSTLDDDKAGPDAKADARSGLQELTSELASKRKAAFEKLTEMHALNARLKLRLGALGKIPDGHIKLERRYKDVLNNFSLAVAKNRTGQQIEEGEEAQRARRGAFTDLMILCEAWFAGDDP